MLCLLMPLCLLNAADPIHAGEFLLHMSVLVPQCPFSLSPLVFSTSAPTQRRPRSTAELSRQIAGTRKSCLYNRPGNSGASDQSDLRIRHRCGLSSGIKRQRVQSIKANIHKHNCRNETWTTNTTVLVATFI